MHNDEYQDLPGISSHWLKAMLDSPAACWRKYLDPHRSAPAPTDSLRLGTLVHGLALTPSQFEREFFVADYERRSHAGKARYAALSATGLTVIKPAELEKARAIVAALHAHPDAKRLLRGGKKERLILQPRLRGLLPLKARLDIHQETRREVVELKTTHDLERFSASLERYRYPLSAAFYRDISQSRSVQFVVVQTREPYAVETFTMTREQLQEGREQFTTALQRFDACWLKNEWPETEPVTDLDDDPLMMPMPFMMATTSKQRLELPVGELAL